MNSFILVIFIIISMFYQVLTLNEIIILTFTPNILVPLAIFSYFHIKKNAYIIVFFLIGLALDTSNPPLFGTYTLSFLLISYLISIIQENLDLQVFSNRIFLISLCNLLFFLIYFLMIYISYYANFFQLVLSYIVNVVGNIFFSILVISVLDFLRMLKFSPDDE